MMNCNTFFARFVVAVVTLSQSLNVEAFLPRPLVASPGSSYIHQKQHQHQHDTTLFVHDNIVNNLVNIMPTSSLALGSEFDSTINPIFSAIKSLAFGVGGVVAVLILLTLIVVNFIIPQAAREVENQVKDQYPDLWNEYQRKLEPGETLGKILAPC